MKEQIQYHQNNSLLRQESKYKSCITVSAAGALGVAALHSITNYSRDENRICSIMVQRFETGSISFPGSQRIWDRMSCHCPGCIVAAYNSKCCWYLAGCLFWRACVQPWGSSFLFKKNRDTPPLSKGLNPKDVKLNQPDNTTVCTNTQWFWKWAMLYKELLDPNFVIYLVFIGIFKESYSDNPRRVNKYSKVHNKELSIINIVTLLQHYLR